MSDTKTIVGTCSGITEKPSGMTEIEVMGEGNKYPLRLATKLEELIEGARDTKGAVATWTFTERDSEKENPHTGKPYKNRYLEKVELGDTRPAQPEAHHAAVHFADKDRTITRMACIKAAAANLDFNGAEDPVLEAMKAAQRFERWVYRDIDPLPFEGNGGKREPMGDSVQDEIERARAAYEKSLAVSEADAEIPF